MERVELASGPKSQSTEKATHQECRGKLASGLSPDTWSSECGGMEVNDGGGWGGKEGLVCE